MIVVRPKSLKDRTMIWIRQLRAPGFVLAGSCCVPLGAAVAWYEKGVFDLALFLLTWIAYILMLEGCFLVNEYYDYKTGCDLKVSRKDITPFSGGSRVLVSGLLDPEIVYRMSFPLYAMAAFLGLYLAFTRSLFIIPVGFFGLFCSYFYTAPPVRIASRGVGEIVTGLNCGALSTLGSYLVQAGEPSWLPLLFSLSPSILLGTLLWVNEIPDLEADRLTGKLTMVVRMGKREAAKTYPFLLAAAYLLLILEVCLRIIPRTSLVALLTLPLAFRASSVITRNYADSQKMVPGLRNNIVLVLAFIAIITVSCL